jgi:DNA-binding MarR family transcriptional regulator
MCKEEERESMSTGRSGLTLREGAILRVLVEDPNLDHHTPAYLAEVTGLSSDDVLSTLSDLERKGCVENMTVAVESARNN